MSKHPHWFVEEILCAATPCILAAAFGPAILGLLRVPAESARDLAVSAPIAALFGAALIYRTVVWSINYRDYRDHVRAQLQGAPTSSPPLTKTSEEVEDPVRLAQLLRAPRSQVRTDAARRLEITGKERPIQDPDVVASLVDNLRHPGIDVRYWSTHALAHARDQRVVGSVVAALQDKESSIRYAAVSTLGVLRAPDAVEPLIAYLQGGDDEWHRSRAAVALGKIGTDRAVEVLFITVHEATARIVDGLVRGLPESGLPASAELLIAALERPEPEVRRASVEALAKVAAPQMAEYFAASLNDADATVRRAAAHALSDLGDSRAIAPLLAFLEVETNAARGWAGEDLARFPSPEVTAKLVEALRHTNDTVRFSALLGLAKLGDPQTAEPLCKLLGDESYRVRLRAAAVLGKLAQACALEPLGRALGDREPEVRSAAAEALGELGLPEALGLLRARLRPYPRGERDFGVRKSLFDSILRLDPANVATLPLPATPPRPGQAQLPVVAADGGPELHHLPHSAAAPDATQAALPHEPVQTVYA